MKREAESLVQIDRKEGCIEIRYRERSCDERYLSWVIPTPHAENLARWWDGEGRRLRTTDLPVIDLRCGSVTISMTVANRIDVRGLDSRGRPDMIGCSLPREAVSALSEILNRAETSMPNR